MNQEMFQDRVGRVLDKMKERQLSQLIMADPKSIWYLTGVDVDPYERLFALLLRADGHHVPCFSTGSFRSASRSMRRSGSQTRMIRLV